MISYIKTMLSGIKQWVSSQKADWNQNDETAANYIKGRPCYETDPKMEYLVKDETVTLETAEGAPGDWAFAELATNISLEVGKTYTVTWDGKEYSVVGTAFEEIVFIGNMLIAGGDDTGEPFVIAYMAPMCAVYGLGAGTHTFSVATMTRRIIPLPSKFLPDIPAEKLPTISSKKIDGLSIIATSGSYNDLSDAPVFASVASSGNYNDLSNIPSKLDKRINTSQPGVIEGSSTTASGSYSHAEGWGSTASNAASHAEGSYTTASGQGSHAEGSHTTASGSCSHAEGSETIASLSYSHAEGSHTTASGTASHAEGSYTTASGLHSHAEGSHTTASDNASHAEGSYTTASGMYSHAEGSETIASGPSSHAEGSHTIASKAYQHVQGFYNLEKDNRYIHIVGNGTENKRSNAHTLDQSGNAWYAGTIEGTAMIVKSSTADSTKRFKITVDDSGTISATEVTT